MNNGTMTFLFRPIVFNLPHFMPKNAVGVANIPVAFWVMDAHRPRNYVDLGLISGTVYCAMCQSVEQLELNTTCYGFRAGGSGLDSQEEKVWSVLEEYHQSKYSIFSELSKETSVTAHHFFPDESLDLLRLNGRDSFEGIASSFEHWRPKLSKHGMIWIDSLNCSDKENPAWRFWNEIIIQKYESFYFKQGSDLGLATVGRDLPEPVQWLTGLSVASPDEIPAVRRFFHHLGLLSTTRYEAQKLTAELKSAESDLQFIRQSKWYGARKRVYERTDSVSIGKINKKLRLLKARNAWLNTCYRIAKRYANNAVIALRPGLVKIKRRMNEFKIRRIIKSSDLFDPEFYCKHNPQVSPSGLSPITHYIRYGAARTLNPGPLFNAALFQKQHPDLDASGTNPIVHYVKSHAALGQDAVPLFDFVAPADLLIRSIPPVKEKNRGKPLFSILIPTYNQAEYLPAALNSLLLQTDTDWEAIVVNDGSTDSTREVLEQYVSLDPRIKVFHKKNGGTGSALNEGLRQAEGDWILWLSSDDCFGVNRLEIVRKYVLRFPDILFFHSNFTLYDDDLKEKIEFGHPFHARPSPATSRQTLEFFNDNYINGITVAIHRDVFDELGMFRTDVRYAQDVDFWLRVSNRYKMMYIPESLAYTRTYSNQASLINPDRCTFDTARACVDFLNQHAFPEIFREIDWDDPGSAFQAINDALDVISNPSSVLARAGVSNVFFERVREYVSSSAGKNNTALNGLLASEISASAKQRRKIKLQLLKDLLACMGAGYTYAPFNAFEEMQKEFWSMVGRGRHRHADAFADYLSYYNHSAYSPLAVSIDQTSYLDTPIIINNRNQSDGLRKLLLWLEDAGYRKIYIFDHGSTDPALLDYYNDMTPPIPVIYLGRDPGPQFLWETNTLKYLNIKTPFVLADPNVVPGNDCPPELVKHLLDLLTQSPESSNVKVTINGADISSVENEGKETGRDTSGFPGRSFTLYRPESDFDGKTIFTNEPYVVSFSDEGE